MCIQQYREYCRSAPSEIRTHDNWLLRPAPLAAGIPTQSTPNRIRTDTFTGLSRATPANWSIGAYRRLIHLPQLRSICYEGTVDLEGFEPSAVSGPLSAFTDVIPIKPIKLCTANPDSASGTRLVRPL